MKRLFIIRHAKSSWKNIDLNDFDRPLNKRGKNNAPFMGKLLKQKNIVPDLILSSPANRAKTTAIKISEELGLDDTKIVFENNIYEASNVVLLNIIQKLDNKYNTIFLVGHNPGLNTFAYDLVEFNDNIPTAGIIELELDIVSWKDLDSKTARLISFEYPKKYIKE